MTPRTFHNLCVGYYRKEERIFKEGWEQTRATIVASLLPHVKSNFPTKIYPLPWDGEKGDDYKKEDPKKKLEKSIKRWELIDSQKKLNRDVE